MELKKEFRNDLLKRNEISFVVEAQKNPSFDEMRKLISENFKKPEDSIDVYNIYGKFGRGTFLVKAYIYDSKSDLEKSIHKSRKQRREEAKVEADAKKAEVEAKKKAEEETKIATDATKTEGA